MLRIHADIMPCDEATLRAALEQYKAELVAHKSTVGVPAPWPAHEMLREIVASGGDFEVIRPPLPPAPEPAPPLFNHNY